MLRNWESRLATKIIFILIIFTSSGCIKYSEFLPFLFPEQTPSAIVLINPTQARQTPEPVETATHDPTDTSISDSTNYPTYTAVPVETLEETATPNPFIIQTGSPVYIANFAHPAEGCDWLGIVGQVFNRKGEPLANMVLKVSGVVDDQRVDFVGVTGIPGADIYGAGSYEIQISDDVFDSKGDLSIQVLNLKGVSMSDPLEFDTYEDCEKNLIVINFMKK